MEGKTLYRRKVNLLALAKDRLPEKQYRTYEKHIVKMRAPKFERLKNKVEVVLRNELLFPTYSHLDSNNFDIRRMVNNALDNAPFNEEINFDFTLKDLLENIDTPNPDTVILFKTTPDASFPITHKNLIALKTKYLEALNGDDTKEFYKNMVVPQILLNKAIITKLAGKKAERPVGARYMGYHNIVVNEDTKILSDSLEKFGVFGGSRKKKDKNGAEFYSKTSARNTFLKKNDNVGVCLYNALIQQGVNSSLIKNNLANFKLNNGNINAVDLTKIANALGILIKLHHLNKKGFDYRGERGNGLQEVSIGLINGHYFSYELVPFTAFAVKNYEKLSKDYNNWADIGGYKKDGSPYVVKKRITSMSLIKLIEEMGLISKLSTEDLEVLPNISTKVKPDVSFDEIDYSTQTIKEISNLPTLSFILKPCAPQKKNESDDDYAWRKKQHKKQKMDFHWGAFDTETYKKRGGPCQNIVWENTMTAWEIDGFERKCASEIGTDTVKVMLDDLVDIGNNTGNYNFLLYAHNLNFDIPFVLSKDYIKISRKNLIYNNGYMSAQVSYTNDKMKKYKNKGKEVSTYINIIFRCSARLTDSSLANIAKSLLTEEITKDIYPYDLLLNEDYINVLEVPLEFASTGVLSKDRKEFEKLASPFTTNGMFRQRDYLENYCRKDVEILMKVLRTFHITVAKLFDVEEPNPQVITYSEDPQVKTNSFVFAFLSISNIAMKLAEQEGCFEYCASVGGLLEKVISFASEGGRTMTARNIMWKLAEQLICIDANSLYPSAMYRLGYFPQGNARPMSKNLIDRYNKCGRVPKWAVMKIRIKSEEEQREKQEYSNGNWVDFKNIRRHYTKKNEYDPLRTFPILSVIDEATGSRMYESDPAIILEKEFIITSIKAERLMMEGTRFEILEGMKWDTNKEAEECCYEDYPSIANMVKTLYDTRSECKKKGLKALEVLYKKALCSIYGKLGTKVHDTEYIITSSKEELLDHILYNASSTNRVHVNGEKALVEKDVSHLDFRNYRHLSVFVLDMSKLIMDEVMFVMEKVLNKPMYYTDTDSITMRYEDMGSLMNKFQEVFNRPLMSNENRLGEFKFEIEDDEGMEYEYSDGGIFLGKKAKLYIFDTAKYSEKTKSKFFKGRDDESTYFNTKRFGTTLKGLTAGSIKYRKREGELVPIDETFNELFEGEPIDFNLFETNEGISTKADIKIGKDFRVSTRGVFNREVQFLGQRNGDNARTDEEIKILKAEKTERIKEKTRVKATNKKKL